MVAVRFQAGFPRQRDFDAETQFAQRLKHQAEFQMEELNRQLEAEIATLSQSYDPTALIFEIETLKPTKTNVNVDSVLWLP